MIREPRDIEKQPSIELTQKDLELIQRQCELQHATEEEQIEGFKTAYLEAKQLALDTERMKDISPEEVARIILEWAEKIEKRNVKGVRSTPVTFRSGNTALDPNKVPRAMESFSDMYSIFLQDPVANERLNPTTLYKEFEEIHPFEDGNGRVGDLLWKVAESASTGEWPEKLPPDLFGGKE